MPRRRLGVGGHQSKPREAGSILARCALRAAFPGLINNDSKPVGFWGSGPARRARPDGWGAGTRPLTLSELATREVTTQQIEP